MQEGGVAHSRYEKQHGKVEWMAASKDTNVYLETMEAARNTEAGCCKAL